MIWYPYEQMKKMEKPLEIVDAKGVKLYTKDKELLDSVSSWWCMIHGYKNQELNEAIKEQLDIFSHVMLGGLTHKKAQMLADRLREYLPGDLNHCFFSDSGSVGVEVALKMAFQYYKNIKDDARRKKVLELTHSHHGGSLDNFDEEEMDRTKVLALKHAYHGDTFKTMEVGDDDDYHFIFDEKKDVIHINTNIYELEEAFKIHHQELYCMIVEPLLQGAGGMRMYDISFLEKARELCDKYGVLLIFDEVATGFGRTGHRFVADLVLPDIIVLGKALTGGYIGHAVTVANEKVYNAFWSDEDGHAFMHGPTFMGNALACSVALKSIEIFERENYMEKIANIEKITRREMKDFESNLIEEVRIMGACVCIEVKDNSTLKGFKEYAYSRGVFARPFLKYMYAMVPYIIEETELISILTVMKDWIKLQEKI